MGISLEDLKEMEIWTERVIRTNHSEQYGIYSDNSAAGIPYTERATRVGYLILQYVPSTMSRTSLNATLILEAEWEQEAIHNLYLHFDRLFISSFGVGSAYDRGMNNIDVFIGEQVMNIGPSHPFQERLGADGLRKQMIEIQDQIESIPAIIDAVIAEQYGEIEDIIESQDLDEEEKRRRVRDKLRVGLEMGLPTIMYERSAEDR